MLFKQVLILSIILALGLSACSSTNSGANGTQASGGIKILAVESYVADMAQNVAGDRAKVDTLIPIGIDPHTYTPTPSDAARIAEATVLITNGAGMESFINKLLESAGGSRLVITASTGLQPRTPRPNEPGGASTPGYPDSHFYLDPIDVIQYVENIRDGLSQADPAGAATYKKNADAYIATLKDLDAWIRSQIEQIPAERRLMVTNHESFGYYADRYGLQIIGAIIPSVSSEASPSAKDLAALIERIKTLKAPAIFLEAGTNPRLAEQVAQDSGAKIPPQLYSHSITGPGGPAPTYIDMLKYDTTVIVNALK